MDRSMRCVVVLVVQPAERSDALFGTTAGRTAEFVEAWPMAPMWSGIADFNRERWGKGVAGCVGARVGVVSGMAEVNPAGCG